MINGDYMPTRMDAQQDAGTWLWRGAVAARAADVPRVCDGVRAHTSPVGRVVSAAQPACS